MNKPSAGKAYQQINAQTGVVDADPHRLIQMLYNGALDTIARARGCIERGEIQGRGEAISKALGIVGGLMDSINRDANAPELTDNLERLYDFVSQSLAEANQQNSVDRLDDATRVLRELQAGWNAIRPQVMAVQNNTEPA